MSASSSSSEMATPSRRRELALRRFDPITASAKNLGKQLIIAVAERGANVVIHPPPPRPRAGPEDRQRYPRSESRGPDPSGRHIQSVAAVEGFFQQILERFGRIDIVVNNIGVILKKNMGNITEEKFDSTFATNTKAPFFMREAAKHIADEGKVINVGTTLQDLMVGHYSAYAGCKAALDMFTRALAKEIGARGIMVNSVAPGPPDTVFFHAQETPQTTAFMSSLAPLNCLGNVHDIVPVIEFLIARFSLDQQPDPLCQRRCHCSINIF
ncbi:hypothetical protein CPB97_003200 [Podila verticillata]|nr:hypothetical protein CPB97_003200 [Podila verticillata]